MGRAIQFGGSDMLTESVWCFFTTFLKVIHGPNGAETSVWRKPEKVIRL